MFVRVWEYTVPAEAVDDFVAAYGSDGDWARLFRQGSGYVGTWLSRDVGAPGRLLTVDRWDTRTSWQDFLVRFGPAYRALDVRLEHLTSHQVCVLEGESDGRSAVDEKPQRT